ncbi:MAG: hypothetical protein A3B86_04105 [Candidatus Yanofskybacteria bacterium RIFCSPHIGHO2_02_FULL_38_22b]|uniref:Uncharacterized protein n=1 Tax=Candidatus Yanofskybacteria bacterium RIFCSPHIGHO2_02_FULL_38_22b TaxID=1802673 RepID=A0A1F8EZH2_9BACT|nr:MAG: hypothetical protein A2816_01875 [Candidatus Yanofskybacteria bacterium RIFCSPHIGHO2_01_FULL_39_44]OGN06274.1 MAG: hypothetical protein A3B86_04105 [Candidatus Yanofskybacteria bacterium RIFCSPHIGHO2_02_FULL_38_22b]OGN19694.1 MAG: hypothetical protein A2910_03840 [Candidatus Yanofskybacteria bacterium RIFCSPLOWO2_01_FULL_39_28]
MRNGFTLIETLIAIAIFAIVAGGTYFAYLNVLDITIAAQLNSVGLTVIGNELEIIRNIQYDSVGVQGGAPTGILLAEKNINFSGFEFVLKTTVRNIDDPFDGVLGGVPNDLAPADFKLVELNLTCLSCGRFIPITSTTRVAPANLESSSKNGNIFVHVLDASGKPISGVDVEVVNTAVNPPINISDITGNNGQLQLVDIATSSLAYEIAVSKAGYSSDQTYQSGDPDNPNPIKPHATVVSQQLTEIYFSIDRLSTQNLTTQDKFCQAIPDINFNQQGSKLIGTEPDILKYSVSDQTDLNGIKTNASIEWDNYTLTNTDPNYSLAGTSLLSPFNVNPNTNYNIKWLMEPTNGSSLMVAVQDGGEQFISDADISLTKTGFNEMKTSGHNIFSQTDWSGSQFSQKSANIDTSSPAGEIHLTDLGGGKYASLSLEWIESNTFDLGVPASFYNLSWNPTGQPAQSGPDSLKFQIAANNDNLTWNYIGPDGSTATYYTNPDSAIFSGHNGNRYFRYKAYLITEDDGFTPKLEDVTIEFSSSCLPSGQSFFSGLADDSYTLTIEKPGFQNYTAPINIVGGWQEHRAILLP